MSFFQRMVGVFVSPSETFEDVVRKPGFWAPLITLILCSVAVIEMMIFKISTEGLVRLGLEQSGRSANMTPEQIDRAASQGAKIGGTAIQFLAFLRPPIVLLVIACVGYLVVNWNNIEVEEVWFKRIWSDRFWEKVLRTKILGPLVDFETVFSVACHAYLVTLLGVPMMVALILLGDPKHYSSENPLPWNLGFFLNPHNVSRPLYTLASSLDILSIWLLILLGIGLSKAATASKIKSPPIFSGLAGSWILLILAKVGLSMIGG